jgi:endonuclease-3
MMFKCCGYASDEIKAIMRNLLPIRDYATGEGNSWGVFVMPLTKKERVDLILEELDRLFPDPPIPLDHKDAYTLLLAVLLSAQCTDERVNQVTPVLFAKADNPDDMARMPEEEILDIVRPCGLGPQKAKAIHRLSQLLVDEYDGEVPASLEALESLPGVGHKTAQVVMAQAYGEPSFPVDTHIHRLAQRWGLTNGKSVTQTEKDLKRLFPRETWNRLHLQIIYFGRSDCTARKVCDGSGESCLLCPKMNNGRKRPKKTRKA